MSDFKEYFSYDVEYLDPAVDPLPMGTEYSYISSTFLNGWINYHKGDRNGVPIVLDPSSFCGWVSW